MLLDTLARCPSPAQNGGVCTAMNKLSKLVEHRPRLHSKLEKMLEGNFGKLEIEVYADDRKQENEDSCPIYKLSNDELKLIFGYVGKKKYRFVACTSCSFHQVYLDTFQGEALTCIKSSVASVSCAALCLHSEEPGGDSHALLLFKTATIEGKLEILIWGEESGYELHTILHRYIIARVALKGHFEVVKYLRQLEIPWGASTCSKAAKIGHLELLKWARAHQCPWNEDTCTNAAINGHLDCP